MRPYITRRLLLIVPTLALVTMMIFGVVRLIPGNVIELMVSEMSYEAGFDKELTVDMLKQRLGMDVPVHVQYIRWVGKVFQGDLGVSLWKETSITEELRNRIPVSLELGLIAFVLGLVIALPVGIYSAIRQDTLGDYVGRSAAILFISLPTFWLGTIVIVYPAIYWNWMPPVQYIPLAENPIGNFGQFIIPGMILGMLRSGTTMRMMRTMMLEVLRQDYIRTAWAKGLSERTVIMRHALKNALIPVVTLVGNSLPLIISGSVVMETIFTLPGMGLLLIEALNQRDYPIISAINLLVASLVLVINLLIDLTYAWLDPRVTYK